MIPLTVAAQVRETLLDYLLTTFNLQDEALEKALRAFLEDANHGLFKGPYVHLRLPYQRAAEDNPIPLDIRPPFLPYQHQLQAFQRLSTRDGHQPQPTLVTTGTGSGKTEAFLYPILDYCHQRRESRGVKAIILYPMNALASDQAARLASVIWNDDRLRNQVTAGIFIGGKSDKPHKTMGPEWIIDDHSTLRQHPPDILLTNYKMLDFLLLRPEDRPLWRFNAPDTLRFLVLDELHTYDGAQGADVACLIRRLKARLHTPPDILCPVGTSATVGGASPQALEKLLDFASRIFAQPFPPEAIIQESLLPLDAFLPAETAFTSLPDDLDALAERPGESAETYAQRQTRLWFGQTLDPFALGAALKQHTFFHALLAVSQSRILPWDELRQALVRWEPDFAAHSPWAQDRLLASFLALIAYARAPESRDRPAPLLTLQVQLWVREMSRLMRAVKEEPGFFWRDDIAPDQLPKGLPAYYCRECGHSGWLSFMREGDDHITDDTGVIYRAYFDRSKHVRYLYPGQREEHLPGTGQRLCPQCLHVGHQTTCPHCHAPTIPVVIHHETSTPDRAGRQPRDLQRCPVCGADNALSIMGSQAASLSSVAIGHLFTTPLNDDKKLLAFTDSVQDASHRAAFFGARTYRFTIRTAIQTALIDPDGLLNDAPPISLQDFSHRLLTYWRRRWHHLPHRNQRLAATFMPPDLREMNVYQEFLTAEDGPIPAELEQALYQRLSWEVTMEYGLNARLGRSLEKVGSSAAYLEPEALELALDALAIILREEIGLLRDKDDAAIRHFVLGLLERTRLRGGIAHPLLAPYANSQGAWIFLTKSKQPLLSPYHKRSPRFPKFLTDSDRRNVFDLFLAKGARTTWFVDWARRVLSPYLGAQEINDLYRQTVPFLAQQGLFQVYGSKDRAYGLNPDHILITPDTTSIRCDTCHQQHTIPTAQLEHWLGQPCLSYRCPGHFQPDTRGEQRYYRALYERGEVERVFAHEHTGLLPRDVREEVERAFKQQTRADAPNLLAATPTLEMGIDIGDLSSAMAISVPPSTTNYLQRIGRAGRKTGNSLILTLANARPHDLYFYEDPLEMIAGDVMPPGLFLDAPNILKRQLLAFTIDAWTAARTDISRLPRTVKAMLTSAKKGGFPENMLRFYEENKASLIEDFLALFDQVVSPENQAILRTYALSDELPQAVRRALDQVREERKELQSAYQSLRNRHKKIEADPAEYQDPEAELQQLQQDMNLFRDLIRRLDDQYILNFFTDAGLLPNYAFPEEGVKFRAIVTGFDEPQANGKRYLVKEYVRPAGQAIRELAPYNTFYAEGRKLQVDHVEIPGRDKSLEEWQFCDRCGYMELVQTHQYKTTCPQCGSAGWSDVGQKHAMLSFHQASAWVDHYDSLAGDESDDRDQASYQTERFFRHQPEFATTAMLILQLPFGFEHFTQVTLRHINFGPGDAFGSKIMIAGQERPVQGFRVCRDCGAVQPFEGDEEQRQKVKHTRSCASRARRGKVQWEDVYLYREMTSEALRILLPVSTTLIHEKLETFAATVALGLRLHLGGDPDHLAIWPHTELGPDGVHRRFLMIYDTVPGGTSYLKDLAQPGTFREVLQLARDALASCPCRLEPGKKACYRCLYSYRHGNHDLLSRQLGLEMVQQILDHWSEIQSVDTLSGVGLDNVLESELEQRFIEALVQWAAKQRDVAINPIPIQGKQGWMLSLAGQEWIIEPQVFVGFDQGVTAPSRPDFILRPHKVDSSNPRTIAVFTDGFAFHVQPHLAQARIHDDLTKRQALVASGRYWVWSITWEDVAAFAEGKSLPAYALPESSQRKLLRKLLPKASYQWHESDAVQQLLQYLAAPDDAHARKFAGAMAATFIEKRPPLTESVVAHLRKDILTSPEPPRLNILDDAPAGDFLYGIYQRRALQLLVFLPRQALKGQRLDDFSVILRLDDREDARENERFREDWQLFWLFANIFQFLPGFSPVTTEQIREQPASPPFSTTPASSSPVVESSAWQEAFEFADPVCRPHLQAVQKAALPPPEVGYELADASNRIIAMAELAWPHQRVALFLPDQPEDAHQFRAQGWRVLTTDDDPPTLVQALTSTPEVI